jgi:anthranilate/para-aminobenzoate synthase component I
MELFLRKKGDKLTTNPIKGTIKRGKTEEIDTILKAKLISSAKERAENLMIVDLMRNDLGRISKIGSVKVNKLFEVETFSTLHQMVSEVEGEIHEKITISEIMKNIFPPGSVTGAPKRRTLEVIDELEPHLRGPYCGTIGIFYPNGDFTLSVAIRIMLTQLGKATFFVGGGIVWDSDPKKEFDETILKSEAITKAMGA